MKQKPDAYGVLKLCGYALTYRREFHEFRNKIVRLKRKDAEHYTIIDSNSNFGLSDSLHIIKSKKEMRIISRMLMKM